MDSGSTNKEVVKTTTRPGRSLSLAYMEERRAKGLCYFYDEVFSPTHSQTHKKLQLQVLEIDDADPTPVELEYVVIPSKPNVSEPQISVNALTGVANFRTMRVTGYHKKTALHILIDNGSTHNFLDINMAKKLGSLITLMDVVNVALVDGTKLQNTSVTNNFSWTLQQTTFSSDMLLISLGCSDLVLGIEWLVKLGNITWNFDKLTMEFHVQGKRHVLRGATNGDLQTTRKQHLHKTLSDGVHLAMMQLGTEKESLLQALTTHAYQPSVPPSIQQLVDHFSDIFQEPTELPPSRDLHDHKIPLLEGTNPVNKRSYRYAKHQKDIIDGLIQEYLKSGIIQHSSSPIASPVVLVGKKDGSWRLCVDYRELNKATIKKKFLIPLVDDLLDELHGSHIFSKIDLGAGYNQVRMATCDIPKTAFRTHGGHFENPFMPFGLTNAPTTFQGLMNAIFKQFLRKCLLVFFDDILIYNRYFPL